MLTSAIQKVPVNANNIDTDNTGQYSSISDVGLWLDLNAMITTHAGRPLWQASSGHILPRKYAVPTVSGRRARSVDVARWGSQSSASLECSPMVRPEPLGGFQSE